MDKLNIFICENFFPELNRVAKISGDADVVIKAYPCLCENGRRKSEVTIQLQASIDHGDEAMVLCSDHCDIIDQIPQNTAVEIRMANYCFGHLADEQMINYLLDKRVYIIGSGWLINWRRHLDISGFDQKTAKSFYQDFCQDIAYFDAGLDPQATDNLKELSQFLGIPYMIIPIGLEELQLEIAGIISEWRLQQKNYRDTLLITDIYSQCSEYEVILKMISEMSSITSKNQVIEKLEEIFKAVYCPGRYKFWDGNEQSDRWPAEIKELYSNPVKICLFNRTEGQFCLKIQHNGIVYGVIELGDFIFPQQLGLDFSLAKEVAAVCGLVLGSIAQLGKLVKAKKQLENFHQQFYWCYQKTNQSI